MVLNLQSLINKIVLNLQSKINKMVLNLQSLTNKMVLNLQSKINKMVLNLQFIQQNDAQPTKHIQHDKDSDGHMKDGERIKSLDDFQQDRRSNNKEIYSHYKW